MVEVLWVRRTGFGFSNHDNWFTSTNERPSWLVVRPVLLHGHPLLPLDTLLSGPYPFPKTGRDKADIAVIIRQRQLHLHVQVLLRRIVTMYDYL